MESSSVSLTVIEDADVTRIYFKNAGFGMPNQQLQEYITEGQSAATEEFNQFRRAIHWVEAWGGKLAATSEIGEGIRVSLNLVKFL